MDNLRVLYGIPTYTQFARARNAIEQIITTSTLVPDQFVVVDNSEKGLFTPYWESMLPAHRDRVIVIPRAVNILAGAWNDLMQLADDTTYMIIANDDVVPHYSSIESLVAAARDNPEYAMVNGSGHSGNSYSYFLLKKWAYDKVGRFDENLKPAYFEDNDWDYRMMVLAGLLRVEVPTATFDHIGSATMRAMTDAQRNKHNIRFIKNQEYYNRKWGGLPHQERFTVEFQENVDVDDD